jgi:hypothetical protein
MNQSENRNRIGKILSYKDKQLKCIDYVISGDKRTFYFRNELNQIELYSHRHILRLLKLEKASFK